MKKILIVILAILSLGLVQAQAQINPDYLTMKKGKFYDETGRVLNDYQMQQIVGNQIYEETLTGATKQFNAGKNLITWGIVDVGVGLVAGAGCYALALETGDVNYIYGMYAGTALMSIGALLLDIGIPLKIIGRSRLNWVADDYNNKKTIALHITGCSTAPGLGLAIDF